METTPTPLVPVLTPLYGAAEPLAYAMMRIASGGTMATFGWAKLFGNGMARDIELFHKLGLEPANFFGYFAGGLEFFGGSMVAMGLLTRPVAAMLLGELLVILIMVIVPRRTDYQLTTVWIGAFTLILCRGGARISVDRWIGREI
jgi:putative oxidoreductase